MEGSRRRAPEQDLADFLAAAAAAGRLADADRLIRDTLGPSAADRAQAMYTASVTGSTPTDRLTASGAQDLGADPSPEDRRRVLERWTELLNGAGPLQVAQDRTELVKLGLPAREVDAALGAWRGKGNGAGDELQGRTLRLSDPEPWPEPVDGAELLEELAGAYRRYLALPAGADAVLALWALHAHAHDAFQVSPISAFTSAVRGCGKTTALTIHSALVPRPLFAPNISPAVLFRAVERFRPSLLIDEVDTYLEHHDELRGLLNAGHFRAGAIVLRSVGDEHEPRAFSVWCPKALAKIGRLPPTLADRALEVRMRRRLPDERLEPVRLDRLGELEPLRRRAWRWAHDNLDALREADPEVPERLQDRAADNARPLLAIADRAGGEWPTRAREALLLLHGSRDDDEEVGVLLLQDLRDIFQPRDGDGNELPGLEKISSADLAAALEKMEDRPWPEWGRAKKPITPTGIARLLNPFGVRPKKIRDGEETFRGYEFQDLKDSISRYLPHSEVEHPEQRRNGGENPESPNRNTGGDVPPWESPENPHETTDVPPVPPQQAGYGADGDDQPDTLEF